MNHNDVIELIRTVVENVKKQGQDVVSVDALLNYLNAVKADLNTVRHIDERKAELDIAVFQAEHEHALAYYDAQQANSLEMMRFVVSYGQAALKSAILINGGSAVALLAFIGNIWSRGIDPITVSLITISLLCFCFGVLSATLGTGGSYITQYCYIRHFEKTGNFFHVLTVAVVVSSYVLFALGVQQAYSGFVEHFAPK